MDRGLTPRPPPQHSKSDASMYHFIHHVPHAECENILLGRELSLHSIPMGLPFSLKKAYEPMKNTG